MKVSDGQGARGRLKIIKSKNGVVLSDTGWMPNLVMKDDEYGVNLIGRQMIGDTTYGIEITHAKIGTDDTAVSETQHDLVAPVNIAGGSNPTILRGDQAMTADDVVRLEFFISDADLPNGTYEEWGLFVGTYGVDERMYARALLSPAYDKASGEDTTVIHEITLTN